MAEIADYVIESDDELYSSRNEKITNEKEKLVDLTMFMRRVVLEGYLVGS